MSHDASFLSSLSELEIVIMETTKLASWQPPVSNDTTDVIVSLCSFITIPRGNHEDIQNIQISGCSWVVRLTVLCLALFYLAILTMRSVITWRMYSTFLDLMVNLFSVASLTLGISRDYLECTANMSVLMSKLIHHTVGNFLLNQAAQFSLVGIYWSSAMPVICPYSHCLDTIK